MKQNEELSDIDRIQVLDLCEVEVLKAMAVVPGMGHLSLFRPERRVEVLETCGMSPKVSELSALWATGNPWDWFDPASMAHSTVVCVDDGVDGCFLSFGFSVYATGLNARVVWATLVCETEDWEQFKEMRTGPPEVAGHPPRLESEAVSVSAEMRVDGLDQVQVGNSDDSLEVRFLDQPQVMEGCRITLERLGLGCLKKGGAVGRTLSDVGLKSASGYCYTDLFSDSVAGLVALALGPEPTAGLVLELYMAACVYGFVARSAVVVTGTEGRFHVERNVGDWRDNLLLLTAHLATNLQHVVGAQGEKGGLPLSSYQHALESDMVVLLNEPMYPQRDVVMPEASQIAGREKFVWRVDSASVFRFSRGPVFVINGVTVDCRNRALLLRTNTSFEFQLVSGECCYGSRRVTKVMHESWVRLFGGSSESDVRHALSESHMFVLRNSCGSPQRRLSVDEIDDDSLRVLHDDLFEERPLDEYRVRDLRLYSGFPRFGGPFVVSELREASPEPGKEKSSASRVLFGAFSVGLGFGARVLAFQDGEFRLSVVSSSRVAARVSIVHDEYSFDEGGLSSCETWDDDAYALTTGSFDSWPDY